jgi:hypothetical protein
MEKEKKQVVFETQVLNVLQELYPDVSQLSKVINQAVKEFTEKEKMKRKQEARLTELSKEYGLPKDILQAQLIARALEQKVVGSNDD